MSSAENSLLDAEMQELRAQVLQLVAENERLKVDNIWLKRTLWGAFVVALLLMAGLLVSLGVFSSKSTGDAKQDAPEGSLRPLFELMQSLFNVEEVERFVRHHFGDEGIEVLQSLASDGSDNDRFDKILSALNRRGMISPALFDALVAVRPNRAESIREIQRKFLKSGSAFADTAAREHVTAS